ICKIDGTEVFATLAQGEDLSKWTMRSFQDSAQLGVEAMLGVVELEAIFEEELGFFGGGAQLVMLIRVDGSQDAVGEAPQAVLQLGDALHNLWRGGLRLDVGV